jgi:hypothetical protein
MANGFSKEERVAFEDILEGFQDALVMSKLVNKYETDAQTMERAGSVIWRPMPYIAQSADATPGSAITVPDTTQLSVPATIGFQKVSPWALNTNELNDALRDGSLGKAATKKLASDINVALNNVAAMQGTLVVKSTTASASVSFSDIAQADALMNESGIPMGDRCIALSSRDYNGLANDLGKASRSLDNSKSLTAYEKAYIGNVAGFEGYKLDYIKRGTAAAGGGSITIATTGTTNNYVPKATSTSVGGQINVDNRYQTVTVSSTTNVAAGDSFTIAGVQNVHPITKEATGQLKTYRVISVTDGTHMVISPPIISASSTPSDAEKQYKNCEFVTTSGTAAIVWLNTAATAINPFWYKPAFEILPGRIAAESGAGMEVLRSTTDNGLEVVLSKQWSISTHKMTYRLDTRFGVVCVNPEMAGIILFNQT